MTLGNDMAEQAQPILKMETTSNCNRSLDCLQVQNGYIINLADDCVSYRLVQGQTRHKTSPLGAISVWHCGAVVLALASLGSANVLASDSTGALVAAKFWWPLPSAHCKGMHVS